MSGLTLTHSESDVSPECSAVFGGGRLDASNRIDSRRIELVFQDCLYTRTAPHSDGDSVIALGYGITLRSDISVGNHFALWRAEEVCPDPGMYVAAQSAWLSTLPKRLPAGSRHYVLWGRDGHVELVATGFKWREWMWISGHRDSSQLSGPIVGEGAQ
jgi:hypothetical protein